jgi:hypothetical protein
VENELPENFKFAIPFNYEGVVCEKLTHFYNEKKFKRAGKTFVYVFSIKYLTLSGMDIEDSNISDDIYTFVNYDLPEITITQLMNANPKVDEVDEVDEGLEKLYDLLEKSISTLKDISISTLKDIRDKINEKS